MDIRVKELLAASSALVEVGKLSLPLPLAYQIAILQRRVAEQMELVDTMQRKLVSDLGIDWPKWRATMSVPEEHEAEAYSKLLELHELSIPLNVTPLRFSELPAETRIAPSTIVGLGPLLTE